MNRAMTWEDFYLICFLVGFALSLLAVLPQHLHIPHVHVPHVHLAHGHGGGGVPFISFPTLAAFLAWFGGTGYLLVRFSNIWLFVALGIAIAGGLVELPSCSCSWPRCSCGTTRTWTRRTTTWWACLAN